MKNFNRVLSIGFGNMGRAFIQPITKLENTNLTILTQNPPTQPHQNTTHFSDINEINEIKPKPFDLIVFACRDYQVEGVMKNIHNRDLFDEQTLFVSIIEGLERKYFYNQLGATSKVALMSPNLAIKVGKGIVSV
jgi:pyrroline-5-carboxylate reductase